MFQNLYNTSSLPVYTSISQKPLIWEKYHGQDLGKRTCHSMTTIGDYIIIFGGSPDNKDDDHAHCSNVIVFDPQKDSWISVLPTGEKFIPRYNHTACLYDGRIIIFGGSCSRVLDDSLSMSFDKQKRNKYTHS